MMKIRVVESLFFMLLLIVSGYYLLTEYQYYHQSSTVFGTVVNTRTVSSAERRLADACTTFRGREDCSALFEYDITWLSGGHSYRYHVAKAWSPPADRLCMNIVQGKPAIAKPCDALFFNVSRLPGLIAIWVIVAFITLTLFLYRKRYAISRQWPAQTLYRIYHRRHRLMLETPDEQEALKFINSGYRISETFHHQKVVGSGRQRRVIHYIIYLVRGKKSA